MTKTAPRPPYGLHSVIPDDALAAWGMRMIVTQAGDVDIVFDRVGGDNGPHTDRLTDLIDERIPLKEIRAIVGELLRSYTMVTTKGEDFILYMDDDMTVHASTTGSHGYCYVTAWLDRPRKTLKMLADEIIADLQPTYDLVYVDRGDQLTDKQVADLVKGDIESLDDSVDEWAFGNRHYAVEAIIKDVGEDVIRRWQREDPEDDRLDDLLDELKGTIEEESVREAIEERDEATYLKQLARGTGDVLLRFWAIDEDHGWSFTEVTPEMVLDQPAFEFIERTEENVKAIQYALDNASPEYSVTLGMWVVAADVEDLLDVPSDGFVEVADPHLWLCNPFTGGGFMTEEPLTGWVTVERSHLRTDKDAFGYSAQEVFGLGGTSSFTSEITAVQAKQVYVLVNTEGGVGAADWRLELDDLPDYGPGDRRYVLTVPNDVTPDELTEAMDAYLGEYALPEPWTSVLIDDKPDPLDDEGNPIEESTE